MIRYRYSTEGVTPDQLRGFFHGWPAPPTPETHLRILQNSDEVVLALDEDANRVVGFVYALTDHVLAAYIPLLEVIPDYQGQGIGAELMRRILERLEACYMVDLLCDADLRPFYARFGMKPVPGMALRRYDRQSGRER